MLQGYGAEEGRLRSPDAPLAPDAPVVWFDLLNPTEEEERALEALIGIDVPTREEMEEIEDSSRLYHEGSAAIMTAMLPSPVRGREPILGAGHLHPAGRPADHRALSRSEGVPDLSAAGRKSLDSAASTGKR